MIISGKLLEFSLSEIFQLLEKGNKTGLLTLRTTPDDLPQKVQNYYIWLQGGRIIAAANRLDGQGLLTIIKQRNWVSDRNLSQLPPLCTLTKPLGTKLKTEGWMQPEHLKIMFYTQVMQQVCALFEFQDGNFKFDSEATLPLSEMSGLSAPATEVTLAGLRALKRWDALSEKLPDPTSGLIANIDNKPSMNLNQQEWKLWEFVDGKTSLKVISKQLDLSIEDIQKIAFRLIAVNLCEEVPLVEMKSPEGMEEKSSALNAEESKHDISESFLHNLMGFLKHRI